MINVDFNNITIKTEPLSPVSTQDVLASIVPSLSPMTQLPQHQKTSSPIPAYPNSYPDQKEYPSTHSSPMMSFGVVKSLQGLEHTTPIPSTTSTRSALKSSILNKRKARGETTPVPSPDDCPREYKLTKREVERKEARKEQNRRAARRCRMKKKRIQQQASQEMQNAVKENVNMKQEVEDLRQQVSTLKKIIFEHEQNENCKVSNSTHLAHQTHSKKEKKKSRYQTYLHPCHVNTKPRTQPPCDGKSSDTHFQELIKSCCPDALSTSNDFSVTTNNISSTLSSITTTTTNINDNNNTFQTPSNNSDFSGDLQSDEVSENIDDILQMVLALEDKQPNSTSNLDPDNKMIFPLSQSDHSPNNSILKKTTNSNPKPSVVRNLNKYFTQNKVHPNSEDKQNSLAKKNNIPSPGSLAVPRPHFPNDTEAQASRFLLDPNLSSPMLSCVPPNLVQQQLISSTNSIPNDNTNSYPRMTSPNTQISLFDNNNNTPFEDQNFIHDPLNNQLHPVVPANDLNDLPFVDIEALSQNTSPTSPFLPYLTCSNLSSEETLFDCCISTTITNSNNNTITNTTSDTFSNIQASPSEFRYQLSPISTPSPSSTATVSSPGFLHQPSPQNLCPFSNNNNNNNTTNNNTNTNSDAYNMVPVFDYNFQAYFLET